MTSLNPDGLASRPSSVLQRRASSPANSLSLPRRPGTPKQASPALTPTAKSPSYQSPRATTPAESGRESPFSSSASVNNKPATAPRANSVSTPAPKGLSLLQSLVKRVRSSSVPSAAPISFLSAVAAATAAAKASKESNTQKSEWEDSQNNSLNQSFNASKDTEQPVKTVSPPKTQPVKSTMKPVPGYLKGTVASSIRAAATTPTNKRAALKPIREEPASPTSKKKVPEVETVPPPANSTPSISNEKYIHLLLLANKLLHVHSLQEQSSSKRERDIREWTKLLLESERQKRERIGELSDRVRFALQCLRADE